MGLAPGCWNSLALMTENRIQDNFMSLKEIIALADSIVNKKAIKAPQLSGWELGELLWWIKHLKTDLK
ncbi:hypothetical protein WB91_22395 [bacteria symbiont BFo1 of Frankliniella occidentalis]|nr:hypothetical protein WB91_22395 [bacteria symbiont BFo1 of Frankliniella occidentalis]CAH0296970.1 hypothetical protein SRABI13_04251 [Erwinia aphidicola]